MTPPLVDSSPAEPAFANPLRPHVVVAGVSGTGKSTVARMVSERSGMPFAEGDEFHSPESIAAMAAGTPLTEEERPPWLRRLAAWLSRQNAEGRAGVVACSALSRASRDVLRAAGGEVVFAQLVGPESVIAERLAARKGHFMPASLLRSQLETLQPLGPDERGAQFSVERPPGEIAAEIVERFGLAELDPGHG
ncbi:gluconokinase [Arthrobacter sp. UM1]|uniref:gluconokinase n=1 Tax=Arthrobacter sp. UM1 TaxID=2766776 RepID=UPI001CF6C566|nr:gluconokinase [Arthrobacter sp. UM1]MCB4208718.1 gluconokinase [Arthrobacter sp. UM1]